MSKRTRSRTGSEAKRRRARIQRRLTRSWRRRHIAFPVPGQPGYYHIEPIVFDEMVGAPAHTVRVTGTIGLQDGSQPPQPFTADVPILKL